MALHVEGEMVEAPFDAGQSDGLGEPERCGLPRLEAQGEGEEKNQREGRFMDSKARAVE